jgi:hypothetical protein
MRMSVTSVLVIVEPSLLPAWVLHMWLHSSMTPLFNPLLVELIVFAWIFLVSPLTVFLSISLIPRVAFPTSLQ